MKKIIALLMTAVLSLSFLTSCGQKAAGAGNSQPPATSEQAPSAEASASEQAPSAEAPASAPAPEGEDLGRLGEILESGKLTVGTSPDFAPSEFIDIRKTGQDQYVGLDMWFARYIAEELGVELEIKAMDFAAVQTSVTLGTIDLALSGFAWKEERAEAMELSDFYNVRTDPAAQGILVMKDQADSYKTAEDFSGKLIAVQEASLQKSLLEEQLPDAEVQLVSKVTDGVMMLISGKVDGVGVAGTNGATIMGNYSEVVMSEFHYEYLSEGNVAGMMKGETALCARINEIIKKAADEGLFEKWWEDGQNLASEIGWKNE